MLPEAVGGKLIKKESGMIAADCFLERSSRPQHFPNGMPQKNRPLSSNLSFDMAFRDLCLYRTPSAAGKFLPDPLTPFSLGLAKSPSPSSLKSSNSGAISTCGSTSTADSDREDCESPNLKGCHCGLEGCNHPPNNHIFKKHKDYHSSRKPEYPPRPYTSNLHTRSPTLEIQIQQQARMLQQQSLLHQIYMQQQQRQKYQTFLSQHFVNSNVRTHHRSYSDQGIPLRRDAPSFNRTMNVCSGQDPRLHQNTQYQTHQQNSMPIPHSNTPPPPSSISRVQLPSSLHPRKPPILPPPGPPKKVTYLPSPLELEKMHQHCLQIQAKIQADCCPMFIIPVPKVCMAHIPVVKTIKYEEKMSKAIEFESDEELDRALEFIYKRSDEALLSHKAEANAKIKISAQSATDAWLANKTEEQQASYRARVGLPA